MRMMEAAEQGRGRYVRIADRLSRMYAPVVHVLAALAFVSWMIATGDWHASIYTAIAVLIITCPCALGLAVPVVHVIGAGRLFELGILMRDGSALERLAEVDRVVFDKTGTLTSGIPLIELPELSAEEAGVAQTLASHSVHPASRAVAEALAGSPRPAGDRHSRGSGPRHRGPFGGRGYGSDGHRGSARSPPPAAPMPAQRWPSRSRASRSAGSS